MTTPHGSDFSDDLMVLATPYALHAMPQSDIDDVETRLASAPAPLAHAFSDEVRSVRETMAVVSASTALEPPAHLRERLLTALDEGRVVQLPASARPSQGPRASARPEPRSTRWRTAAFAAAAAVVIGLGTVGVGIALRPDTNPTAAEQILSAPDVRTVSGDIPTGGTATLVFSRERNAGVLVMNDVAPPKPGTVYQMWLVSGDGAASAGTMNAEALAPSTTAVLSNLGNSDALAFTVEPGSGSTIPTNPIFAELPLI